MKKFYTLLLAMVCSLSMMAYDFTVTYEGSTFNFNYRSENDHTQLTLVSATSLASQVIIPDYVENLPVTVLGELSLYNKSFTTLLLPRTLKQIHNRAIYSSNPQFTTLTIPENVDTIGYQAIYAYYNNVILRHLTWMPKNCKVAEGWIYSFNSSDVTITIAKTCQYIPSYFMKDNTGLSSITIPYGVKKVGDRAFMNCTNLRSIEIGESVTQFGEYAFFGCKNLNSMLLAPATPPTCTAYCFHDVPLDAYIEVPCNSVSKYASAPEWKYFWAFEETILYKATVRVEDDEQGTACVEQDCRAATFTATAAPGYRFKQWSNGSLQNPLTINLTESIELVAEFEEEPTAIEDIMVLEQEVKIFRNGQLLILRDGKTYNMMGIMVE